MPQFLTTPQGRRLAFHQSTGTGPGVIFLGGFRSDMTGTKAEHMHAAARAQNRAFLRFDYSGHGASSGAFEEGCISDWAEDAACMLEHTRGPQILIGSSMGGWIALLLARRFPNRIKGFIGIAAAPDFTETLWGSLTDAQRADVHATGHYREPSAYAPEPYIFTRQLFQDGARNLVLQTPLDLPFPVRLLQGSADDDVPVATAQALFDHIKSPDLTLTLVKNADHRFSSPACLALICHTLERIA